MRSLVWFRRDLRVVDNRALFQAAKESENGVVGLFVITPKQWKEHDDADCKVKFWLDNLAELSTELAKLNIPLRIVSCGSFDRVPSTIVKFAQQHNCSMVYWNREYEFNERRRDEDVAAQCAQSKIDVCLYDDRVIVPPSEISTRHGSFYSVFTPYRRVWDTKALDFIDTFPKPRKQLKLDIEPTAIPHNIPGFNFNDVRNDAWKPGEKEAHLRLRKFTNKISAYNDARDIPSLNGTSLLSPYLTANSWHSGGSWRKTKVLSDVCKASPGLVPRQLI